MKIESTDITMDTDNSFIFEEKQSSEFISTLISNKLDIKDKIDKQNFVRSEIIKLEKILLSSEKDLTHQDRIKKKILETILSNFTNNKDVKLQPTDEYMNKKSERLIQIEKKTFNHTKEYHQKSSVEYNTKALIQTNRGEIHIDLNISFSQEFYKKYETTITSKKIIYLDPLIINYKSNLTTLDNISSFMKFEFDLNSDGKNELIPELKNGTGFLALDKNKNETIDNGNELFGVNTGNGFDELRKYDDDKNSWIDENDSIFDNLLIWEKNENGDNSLITLAQAGIGAIYLSAVDSGFTYSRGINEDYARLKQSSFHIKEDGKIGLVTSVDFAT